MIDSRVLTGVIQWPQLRKGVGLGEQGVCVLM